MHHPLPPHLTRLGRVLAGALMLALGLVGVAGSARAADPYPGTVPTSCTVALDASAVGRDLVATVDVGAPGTSAAAGVLTAVFDGPEGELATQSVDYTGGKVVLRGPRATDQGRYDVHVRFVPRSGSIFTKCSGSDGVDVGVSGIDDEGDDPVTPPSGGQAVDDGDAVLPNTGGPSGWLLFLAGALLVVGSGLMVTGRRRSRG